jgi:hypothetical protein
LTVPSFVKTIRKQHEVTSRSRLGNAANFKRVRGRVASHNFLTIYFMEILTVSTQPGLTPQAA